MYVVRIHATCVYVYDIHTHTRFMFYIFFSFALRHILWHHNTMCDIDFGFFFFVLFCLHEYILCCGYLCVCVCSFHSLILDWKCLFADEYICRDMATHDCQHKNIWEFLSLWMEIVANVFVSPLTNEDEDGQKFRICILTRIECFDMRDVWSSKRHLGRYLHHNEEYIEFQLHFLFAKSFTNLSARVCLWCIRCTYSYVICMDVLRVDLACVIFYSFCFIICCRQSIWPEDAWRERWQLQKNK